MEKIILASLDLLGLNPKEIKFFVTCLKSGPSSINEVASASKLQRSTAYLIAEKLLKSGYLEEDLKSYKKKVTCIKPERLLQMIENRGKLLKRQEAEIIDNLPELQALYQTSEIRPKVKVYEGNNGLLSVWKDILSSRGEVLLWTNQETENLFFNEKLHLKFIEERIKRNISIRVLAVDNKEGKKLMKSDKECLRQTKLLSEGYKFSPEIYIYDNKIATLDYNKDIIGVIIESQPITEAQKTLFEMLWNSII
ncbi:MAG: helix-turn-helix domain-containing protein [Candidatus Daviesbacteria bacterium]|nr:helix-turn-helix domain-containing protein [Candidatus Daviesbacteria bacterium]